MFLATTIVSKQMHIKWQLSIILLLLVVGAEIGPKTVWPPSSSLCYYVILSPSCPQTLRHGLPCDRSCIFSVIVPLFHMLASCPRSYNSRSSVACVDSCLIECGALTFLFALIIGVDFISARDEGPLPPSPHTCLPLNCVNSAQEVPLSRDRKSLNDM